MSDIIKKKVSVVIPYYNDSKVFERCILSVIQQTYSPNEVIIIDDNSDDSDELNHIIGKYKKKIAIIYERNSINKNAAFSRNRGVCLSNCEIIAFLDADDYWHSEHLNTSINQLIKFNADFVYSNVIEINPLGEMKKRKVDNISQLENAYDVILKSPPQTGSFVLYKKLMDEVRFDESLRRHQDYQFLIDVIRTDKKHHYIDTYNTYYCESHRPFSSRVNFDSMFKFWSDYYKLFTEDLLKKFLIRNLCLSLRIKGSKKISWYLENYKTFEITKNTAFIKLYKVIGDNNIISKTALFLFFHLTYNINNIPRLLISKSRVLLK
ncbi:glycosyltransferase [Klebsiella michiganensis]|uniref:glycosyltransferase family 2 protein n=1 Tax=Klebsiella michiganensis TaxID=1134687 RepID=UPI001AEA372E|nr:glycosyltransferase [Klebsiella michiganensis]ELT1806987.1 glycosyltransferase [Klebsiella michiganensis]